jgi:hypothetical protein
LSLTGAPNHSNASKFRLHLMQYISAAPCITGNGPATDRPPQYGQTITVFLPGVLQLCFP